MPSHDRPEQANFQLRARVYICSRGCFVVLEAAAASRAFRTVSGLPCSVAEAVVVRDGASETRTDMKQANRLLLAQESAAVRAVGN